MIVVVDNTLPHSTILCKPYLIAYLKNSGYPYLVARTLSGLVKIQNNNDVSGFILSGSAQHLHKIDKEKTDMNTMAIESGLPVLGICFGSQFINCYFGGTIKYIGPTKSVIRDVTILKSNKTFEANFIASYYIHTLAPSFKELHKESKTGRVVFFKHKRRKIYGVLYHPESSLAQAQFVLGHFISKL
jgi:GMP synthase-like glutamine amidotransferase